MEILLNQKQCEAWSPLSQAKRFSLALVFLLAACAEPAPRGADDVADIPLPSQDLGDDDDDASDDDDSVGDDDDASDDDDSVGDDDDASDDDDSVGDDDDSVGDDDDSTPEPTSPVNYALTDIDSLLYVQVFKDPSTIFSGLAHDHVMRASNWNGTFEYDPADLSSCVLDISIPVDDLLVDEDGMRALVGYGDTISNADRNTIRQNMLGSDQLNSSSFSQISVLAQTCGAGTGAGPLDGSLEISAEMELRGVTKTKTIVLDLTVQNDEAYIQGSFNLTATEFGFDPYQFLGGGVRNLDQMTISFDMVGFATN